MKPIKYLVYLGFILGCSSSFHKNKYYEYSFRGNLYKVKIRKGEITDTAFILDSSMNEIEASVWSKENGKFKQHYLFTNFDTTFSPINFGGRSKASTLSIIQEHRPEIRHLYNESLSKWPGLKGRITLKIWLNKDGSIEKIIILEDTSHTEEFALKILKSVSVWKFGSAVNDDVQCITVPFSFNGIK